MGPEVGIIVASMVWGAITGFIAHLKGYDHLLYFVIGALLGWVGALAMWLLLPNSSEPE